MAEDSKRPPAVVAWTICGFIFIGFVVAGIGVIEGWPVFWTGIGIVGLGTLAGWLFRVMEYTEEYEMGSPDRVEPGSTTLHG